MNVFDIPRIHVIMNEDVEQSSRELNAVLSIGNPLLNVRPKFHEQRAASSPRHRVTR